MCHYVVEGGVGYAITPVKIRKIGDFTWGDEEYRRVAELMEWMIR